jgi:Zn-dependent protease with chaperone function
MIFFEQQQSARDATRLFTVLFALFAIPSFCCFTVITILLFGWAFGLGPFEFLDAVLWGKKDLSTVFAVGASGTFILSGALVLVSRLHWLEGARYVSANIECVRVLRVNSSGSTARTRNIVEEMSLAAGLPPPELYVWSSSTINAIAVGHGPADAALFITRGAVEELTRDEMQALVAHGVAQIVNGDMALNGRLAAFLLVYEAPFRVSMLLFALPVVLFLPLGKNLQKIFGTMLMIPWVFTGLFPSAILTLLSAPPYLFGRLLKWLVIRQRKGLADACAVQFTRNPASLRTLLRKARSSNALPDALPRPFAMLSHAFFVPPIRGRHLSRLVGPARGDYPGIDARIRELGPGFEDEDEPAASRETHENPRNERTSAERLAFFDSLSAVAASLPVAAAGAAMTVAQQMGAPARTAVRSRRDSRPRKAPVQPGEIGPVTEIAEATDPRAVLLALLVDRKPATQQRQIEHLRQWFDEISIGSLQAAFAALRPFEHTERTLALDLHLSALRALPRPELQRLEVALAVIEDNDDARDAFEFGVTRAARVFITDVLRPRPARGSEPLVWRMGDINVLLTAIAQTGDRAVAASAYLAGMRSIDPNHRFQFVRLESWTRELDLALDRLDRLAPMAKQMLLEALSKTIRFDRQETPAERELLRTVASSLHCPLPRVALANGRARLI